MSADADRLNELIARVLDGKTIDWAGAESRALDSEEHLSVTALRDVARIAGFSRDLQRAGHAPRLEEIALGDLAMLLCFRAEAEDRAGDRAAAGAAFRAAEILADQVGATPGSLLCSRIEQLRARLS